MSICKIKLQIKHFESEIEPIDQANCVKPILIVICFGNLLDRKNTVPKWSYWSKLGIEII